MTRTSFPAVATLLPHRPPMLLLAEVLAFCDGRIRCAATITRACPLVVEGRLPCECLLEYMAQAVGCMAALERDASTPSEWGLITSVRELVLKQPELRVSAADTPTIVIEAKRSAGSGRMGSFAAEVAYQGHAIASAELFVLAGGRETWPL